MLTLEDYTYFTTTRSLCPACGGLVDAKVVFSKGKVYFLKHCPKDGPSQALVCGDVAWYLDSLTYLKPGTEPKARSVETYAGCPTSCGLCPQHQQHTCVPIIEITDHCDLKCPLCLVKNRDSFFLPFEKFQGIMDTLERCEGSLNLVNLSGGEPTLHPEFRRFVEHLASRKVAKTSVSTNGLGLLKQPDLVDFLKDHGVVVSLQLDGFEPATYKSLRGTDLSADKKRVLDLLIRREAPFSMTVTMVRGVNEAEVPGLLELFFKTDQALSMMFQPCCHTGTGGASFGRDPMDILTIPDVVRLIADGSGGSLKRSDFLPLPCSHPACFALTYLIKLPGGGFTPIPRIFELDDYLDVIKNNALFGMDEGNVGRIKDSIYRLWTASGSIPDRSGALKSIKAILSELNELKSGFSPKAVMSVTEKHVKSIFIHHFMDSHTFDLSRAVKCCQHYPIPDGRPLSRLDRSGTPAPETPGACRLMPACVFNNLCR
ncbi:MAG: radical SAM protein [Elusimicrobia bacterium]|nr:radical SAM protein [Elusimicrobiota bacterium]